MGLFNFLRRLFKKEKPAQIGEDNKPEVFSGLFKSFSTIESIDVDLEKFFGVEKVQHYSRREAGNVNGDLASFKLYLAKIYGWYSEERRSLNRNHDKETNEKILEIEALNQSIENKIAYLTTGKQKNNIGEHELEDMQNISKEDIIPFKMNEIKKLKEEIRDIQEKPKKSIHIEDYDDDKPHKLIFAVSLFGMLTNMVFLWIFYSSVIYSSVFRIFIPGKNLFFESILYPRAVEEAFTNDGFIIGVAVCFLPFIIMSLSFVFEYYFSSKKYLIAVPALIFAFAVDTILAYRITDKIYQITHTTFAGVAEYSIALAVKDVNYWIIILLGFGSYVFLGFVYHIFVEALKNLNIVKRAIKKRKDLILQLENEIKVLKEEVEGLKNQIVNNKRKITAYRESLHTVIFGMNKFKEITDSFVIGWFEYQEHNRKDMKPQTEKYYYDWLENIQNSLAPVKDIY